MNDQNIHPLIRYGGPILGAVIVYFIITSMIGGFQSDMEAARVTPLAEAVEAAEVEATPAPAAVDSSATVTETTAITDTAAMTDTVAITDTSSVGATEAVTATETVTESAAVSETVPLTVTAEVTATEAVTDTAPVTAPITATETTTVTAPAAPQSTVPATIVKLSGLSEEEIYAGLPAEIAAFFPDGVDVAVGEQTALNSGCTACHSLLPDVVQVGPSWYGVADRAGGRVPEQGPALYLYTSITNPTAHVVPDFQPNLMPNIYNQLLTQEQIAHVIAYLLTLEAE